jgi:16S rRNA (cytidine1402-2'-O)-methyltransferase
MLYVVATPIGNWDDITVRARQILANCDAVIGEELRQASTLLKKIGAEKSNDKIYLLNEHSKPADLKELVELCAEKNVALISDCGTPGFADPGPALVKLCRSRKIAVTALPGASALTTLLSLTSEPVREFVFFGFLPQENVERDRAMAKLRAEPRPWILMDTPYRIIATLEQLAQHFPNERALLGLDLTQESEKVFEDSFAALIKQVRAIAGAGKFAAEFMLLKYARG